MKYIPIILLFLTGCFGVEQTSVSRGPRDTTMVNVGYGKLDKRRITGSVAVYRPTPEEKKIARTVLDFFETGNLPGCRVQYDSDGPHVVIRGHKSLVGSNDPLVVIDSQPFSYTEGLLEGMNPDDVDTITVLKDAGAAAVYGSQGANGVILIETVRYRRR